MNAYRKIIRFLLVAFAMGTLFMTSGVSYAAPQSFGKDSGIGQTGSSNFSSTTPQANSIQEFIQKTGTEVLNIALVVIGIVAVLFLILYAFQYITAGGDPEKAKKARSGIINAIIGIIVAALAFSIVQFSVRTAGTVNNASEQLGKGTTL